MARRQPREGNGLRRRAPTREPYERVLIVCEGEKTEPIYFSELKDHYRLSNANIAVTRADGTDPLSSGNHSPCDNCIRMLKQEDSMHDYAKGRSDAFRRLLSRIEIAKQHAHQARQDAEATGDNNPSTEVHELVDYLQHLKDPA